MQTVSQIRGVCGAPDEWVLWDDCVFTSVFGCFVFVRDDWEGDVTSKAALYLPVIIIVDNLFVELVGRGLARALSPFFLQLTRRHHTAAFWSLLSHLKPFHKTDYAADESITFQLLLVQDAEMKLDENIIVGDILGFSFITGMEWVIQWWGFQSLNQLRALPGSGGCAAC